MQPINLYTSPVAQPRFNSAMMNNPFFPEVKYNPVEMRAQLQNAAALSPVNQGNPGGQWSARPVTPPAPATVNASPAAPTITARPLSGPVSAPPVAKIPTAPRGVGGGGVALALLPLTDSLAKSAVDALIPGPPKPAPTRTNPVGERLGTAGVGATIAFGGPLAAFGAGAAIAGALGNEGSGKPEGMPNWLWPYPADPDPNDLDPAAMDSGPVVSPGSDPLFTGGQSQGVLYSISYNVDGSPATGVVPSQLTYGPITGLSRQTVPGPGPQGQNEGVTYPGTANGAQIFLNLGGTTGRWLENNGGGARYEVTGLTIARVDGQADTGGNTPGGTDPVRSPNPARQTAPAASPRTLPPPAPAPAPSDLPWPQVAPQGAPQDRPFAEPDPPAEFSATPTPEPLAPTAPDKTDTPTDLEAPSETPPNLADKAPKPTEDNPVNNPQRIVWPGLSAPSFSGASTSPLLVAIPVVLLDGLKQKINTPSGSLINRTQTNPNLQKVASPPVNVPTTPNPPTCIYERQRVMDIQNKTTDVQGQTSNPVTGFPGLYGIGIESRLKLGQTFTLLETVNNFMRKAWQSTRLQKVLDLLTFIGVMHNVSMLSRNVGTTFLEVVGQGIQAVGIRDEEDNVIDVPTVVNNTVASLLRSVLGNEVYEGINENWNKASRIISSASAIIWTVRSIADSGQDLMEWIGENTGKIGNALKRWRVVGEKAYPDMSERAQAAHRMRSKFSRLTGAAENIEDRLSVYSQATSSVIDIQEESSELLQNYATFRESVINGVPDPWVDNNPVKDANAQDKADSLAPTIETSDSQQG